MIAVKLCSGMGVILTLDIMSLWGHLQNTTFSTIIMGLFLPERGRPKYLFDLFVLETMVKNMKILKKIPAQTISGNYGAGYSASPTADGGSSICRHRSSSGRGDGGEGGGDN